MNYALVEDGVVINMIWLYPGNENEFPGAVAIGNVPVMIGDTYDGQYFMRDGKRVLTPMEEAQKTIEELDAALLEAQYQSLIGGLEL